MLPKLKDFLTEKVSIKDLKSAFPDAEKANSMPGKVARQSGHHLLQKQLDYQLHPGTYRFVGIAYGHHHYHSKSPSGNERVFHHEQSGIAKNGAQKYAHTGVYHGQHMEGIIDDKNTASAAAYVKKTWNRKPKNFTDSRSPSARRKDKEQYQKEKGMKEELGNVPGSDMTEKKEIKEVFSDAISIKKGTVQKVSKSAKDDPEIWIARHPNGKIHYTKDKKWAHAWAAGTAKELDKPQEWKKRFIPPAKAIQEYMEPNHFMSREEPTDGQIKSAEFLKDIPLVLPKSETEEQGITEAKKRSGLGTDSPKHLMSPGQCRYCDHYDWWYNPEKEEFRCGHCSEITKGVKKTSLKEGMENLEPGKHIYLGQGGEVRHPDKSQKHYYLAHHKEKGLALFGHDNKDVVELRARQYAANGAHHHLQEDANILAREDEMNPGTHRRNKNGTFSGAHPRSGKIRHFWHPDAAKSFASGKKYEIPMEVRNKIARMALDSYKKKHGLTMKNEDKLAPPLFMVP